MEIFKKTLMKKYNVYGIKMTSLQQMRFYKHLEQKNISMNTLQKKERTLIAYNYLNETKTN